jgi:hypothetical protein
VIQHRVVEARAELFDPQVGAALGARHPVGEQHDDEMAGEVDPQAGAGEAEVTDGDRSVADARAARRRFVSWRIEAERAGAAGVTGSFSQGVGGASTPSSTAWPKRAAASAVPKTPAWPLTPSMHQQLSSSTSPGRELRGSTSKLPSWPGAGSLGRRLPVGATSSGIGRFAESRR